MSPLDDTLMASALPVVFFFCSRHAASCICPSVLSLACHTIRIFIVTKRIWSGRRGFSEVRSPEFGTQHTRDVPWHDMVDIF